MVLNAITYAQSKAKHENTAISYDTHIREILKSRCFKCHGDDDQQSDLNLQSYASALKGGASGAALKPGKPNSSLLFQAIMHEGDVSEMPPNSDKIPAKEIELIRQWIVTGLPENSESEVRGVSPLVLALNTAGKPEDPAMPTGLPTAIKKASNRPSPVTALTTSPWSPLVAVSGHQFVRLLHSRTKAVLGILPFEDGIPHSIQFSQDGSLLLVAGGKPAQNGLAALFDVRTGKRLASFGDEIDVVLTADLSADGSLIAIGGPSKTVKVYRSRDGKSAYRLTKHTDWITALEFSPDGKLLATADRAGGLHLWDAKTGGIALSLSEHKDSITSLNWRADSRFLASASEDGSVIVWDAKDGWPASTLNNIHKQIRKPNQYGKLQAGVLDVAWTNDGYLLTIGRDKKLNLWTSDGKRAASASPFINLPTGVAFNSESNRIWVGDNKSGMKCFRIERSGMGHSLVPVD